MKVKIVSIFFLLVLMCLGFFQRHVIASTTISFSSYSKIASDIYVGSLFSPDEQISIALAVESAKERVASKFGNLASNPIFIASSNEARSSKFFPGRVTPGITNTTPWGQYIPLAPDGLNVDVMAHELVHAEVFHRLGFIKSLQLSFPKPLQSIPVWFNEGIAMQVDYRKGKVWSYIQDGVDLPGVAALESGKEFMTGDIALHYAASKVEVQSWLESNGYPGLYTFIDDIKNGDKFDSLYVSSEF